jgi:hypothetical protein
MNRLTVLLLSGFVAGTAATVAQLLLWWLNGASVGALLLRDTCLAAAIVLGTGALTPPLTWNVNVLLAAALIHLLVSFTWAWPATLYAARLKGPALLVMAGIAYGMAVYLVDLYGFTYLFPWFAVSRGANTLIAHGVFGLALFSLCNRLQTRGK